MRSRRPAYSANPPTRNRGEHIACNISQRTQGSQTVVLVRLRRARNLDSRSTSSPTVAAAWLLLVAAAANPRCHLFDASDSDSHAEPRRAAVAGLITRHLKGLPIKKISFEFQDMVIFLSTRWLYLHKGLVYTRGPSAARAY